MAGRKDDGYDDRPKKSWRDIDKARDGSQARKPRGEGGGGGSRAEEAAKAATYGRFKSAADAFFAGTSMPEGLASRIDPEGEGRARREALQKLRNVEEFKEFVTLVKDYIDKHGMPEDPYVLDRLLTHPKDELVLKGLAEINRLLDAGTFKPPKSLEQRLKSLELGSDSPEIQDTAKALVKRVRNLPK